MSVEPLPPENPYASPTLAEPAAVVESTLTEFASSMEAEELRAAVGRNANYYLGQWADPTQRRGPAADVNWSAFFFCGWWLAYRKMYRQAIAYYVAIFVLFTAAGTMIIILDMPKAMVLLVWAVTLGAPCMCAKQGNVWYRHHVARLVADSKSRYESDAWNRLAALRREGGTNLLAALGFVLISLLSCFGVVLVNIVIFSLIRSG